MSERGASYRELGPLAEGGMAVLTRAQRSDDLEVVIKRIRPPWDQDASFRRLFEDEGRVALLLDHPRIVRCLDAGEDELGPYLVFEHVEGTDLAHVLEGAARPLELAEILAVGIPLFDALKAAHAATGDDGEALELVHRDVSPGNILLSQTGEVKLADFGVARSTIKRDETLAGEMKGKFAYMAPEQTRGDCAGPCTDLFAAGIVLYECATGEKLFDGPTEADIALAVREQEAPRASDKNPRVPEALDELIARLLTKDPKARLASAEEAKAGLEEIAMMHGLERGLRRHAAALASSYPRQPPEEHPHVQELRRRTQRVIGVPVAEEKPRSRAPIFAALAAVVVAIVVGVVVTNTDERKPVETVPPREIVEPSVGMSVDPALTKPVDKPEVKDALGGPTTRAVPTKKVVPIKRPRKVVAKTVAPPTFGFVAITSTPWSQVFVDGKRAGDTPLLKHKLPTGKHTITLKNPHFNLENTSVVEVGKDRVTKHFVMLRGQ